MTGAVYIAGINMRGKWADRPENAIVIKNILILTVYYEKKSFFNIIIINIVF